MAILNISDEDKRKLRSAAKSEIERLENLLKEDKNIQIVDAFKNYFNVCESAYKIILAEHQKTQRKKSNNSPQNCMRQVPSALTFAGYTFEKQLLSDLFGGKPTAKGRTAKQLRDGTSHSIDESAVKEIVSCKDELSKYMDEFLEIIKTFDEVAA